MIRSFRKKPVVIEAIQYDGANSDAVKKWVNSQGGDAKHSLNNPKLSLVIHTSEGDMNAQPGDWIIKGIKGEFYPCKPDIFEATYEGIVPTDKVRDALSPEDAKP